MGACDVTLETLPRYPEGTEILTCIQCGVCTGTCPYVYGHMPVRRCNGILAAPHHRHDARGNAGESVQQRQPDGVCRLLLMHGEMPARHPAPRDSLASDEGADSYPLARVAGRTAEGVAEHAALRKPHGTSARARIDPPLLSKSDPGGL